MGSYTKSLLLDMKNKLNTALTSVPEEAQARSTFAQMPGRSGPTGCGPYGPCWGRSWRTLDRQAGAGILDAVERPRKVRRMPQDLLGKILDAA